MKKLIIAGFMCLVSNVFAQRFFYVNGVKQFVNENKEKVLLTFDNTATQQSAMNVLPGNISNHGNLSILKNRDLAGLKKRADVTSASFVIEDANGNVQGLKDEITVKLKSAGNYTLALKSIEAIGGAIVSKNAFVDNQYLVKIPKSTKDAIDVSNELYATGYFEFAEPNFVRLINSQTADPLFPNQWGLKNTGQYSGTVGADIKAEYAWSVTKGSSAIKVAVIDEGVSLTHPDLAGVLLPGYDATGLGSGGGPSGNDAHGTACAGIIAARSDNGLGGTGIAPNCRILPVRIAYKSGTSWVTDDNKIANGINWAWQNGADVLSNSWGGGSPSSTINNAIVAATTSGRAGKGSVVVFASGNSNGAVNYPANHPNVFTVGAMSMCNQRKSPSSCDGETWWGSNFGAELDVVAPGVLIPTCDIPGAAGYNSGDYVTNFNGTSSACPHVSAISALVLSVNPALTWSQVYSNLRCTANKVGSYTYTGGFNSEMGYGRVNAFNAIMGACIPSYQLTNVIPSGKTITYQASTRIYLEPGFRASAGSSTAIRLGCASCPIYSPLPRVEDAAGTVAAQQDENLPGVSVEKSTLFPNPITTGNLYFGRKVGTYLLLNGTGEIIQQGSDSEKLDVTGLAKGLYMLRLDDRTEKVVIE